MNSYPESSVELPSKITDRGKSVVFVGRRTNAFGCEKRERIPKMLAIEENAHHAKV